MLADEASTCLPVGDNGQYRGAHRPAGPEEALSGRDGQPGQHRTRPGRG